MVRDPRDRPLSPEERRLWRRVARTVKSAKPLPEAAEESTPVAKRERVQSKPVSSTRAIAPSAVRATPKPPLAPVDRGGERRVRRGKLEIAAKLDLHGHTQESARAAVLRFVASAPAPCVVLIVTGRGRAGEVGVLKRRLPDWLADPAIRPRVSGFAQAHQSHGGAGAFYIFVRPC